MSPLTPQDCDLKDFAFMPLEVSRFLDSSFNATLNDMAWRAGVTLWLKSWHQVPAASLPDDEATLASLAGLGRDVKTWRKIKSEAMRGWIKADDGLLYHPVVAEKALEAWLEKLSQRLSSGAGNATRWGAAFDPASIERQIAEAVRLLSELNPNSKALSKKRKKPSHQRPIDIPAGDEAAVPTGSQETLKGQGRDNEGTRASSEALTPSSASMGVSDRFDDWLKVWPGQVGPDAKPVWQKIVAMGVDPGEVILGTSDKVSAWSAEARRAADATKFLSEGKWQSVRPPGGVGGTHTAKARPGDFPESLWDMVVAERDEAFAAAYLAQCAVDLKAKTLSTKTGMAVEKLRNVSCLTGFKITQRKAAA